jgi:imidazolonepropionase-like amidohydrolase
MLITNARVLDVHTGQLSGLSCLRLHQGLIAEIAPHLQAQEHEPVLDAQGMTAMPGLIDCHVHVVASSFNLSQLATQPNALTLLRAIPILRGMLQRGFTTVRDAGGADWSLAEAVRTQLIAGPKLLTSGKALLQTGGHADFRNPHELLASCNCFDKLGRIGRVVDGVDACRKAVRETLLQGASQIKIMASGGVTSASAPLENLGFSLDEIRAIVEEAQNAHTYVMAHAYTPQAIERAVRCGVRSIEHANLIDARTAEVVKEHGAYVVPTLVTYEGLFKEGVGLGLPPESLRKIHQVKDQGKASLEILAKAGVPMGFGTDLLASTHNLQSEELALRAEVLGNLAAIQQATCIAADLLHLSDRIGVLQTGAAADLLLVRGNPVQDIRLLIGETSQIAQVVQDGRLVEMAGG